MIDGIKIVEPKIFIDERGFFFEVFSKKNFIEKDINIDFIQANHSKSKKGVLRGVHFQSKNSQSKLVRIILGSILDIAVDLRRESNTFGKYFSIEISKKNRKMLFIPKGFAHGFLSLENDTEIEYFCDEYYSPEFDSGILWNDKDINIEWNFEKYNLKIEDILLSEKDKKLQTFKEFVESGVVIE